MNAIAAVRGYIERMLDEVGPGMKVLLLDEQTMRVVTLVYSHSEVLQKEVYLLAKLNQPRETMKHLKAVVLVRPSDDNLHRLCAELRRPNYGSYHIFFSNIVSKSRVKQLAEADEHEVVRDVQEYYADYLALNTHLFALDGAATTAKMCQGLVAVFLSLKRRPFIRYQSSGGVAKKLAEALQQQISQEDQLFDFPQSQTVLLILDRRIDCSTPLIMHWTYQALVHELFGVENNMVAADPSRGLSEVTALSPSQDPFYSEHLNDDYGTLLLAIKKLLEDAQKAEKDTAAVQSIADMKSFIAKYPQFKKLKKMVLSHVSLLEAIGKQVESRGLLEVSEAEQTLSCGSSHSEALSEVKRLLSNNKLKPQDAKRLVALYALRYGRHPGNELSLLLRTCPAAGELVNSLMEYNSISGEQEPQSFQQVKRNIINGLRGVENVLTQHKPVVDRLLQNLLKGRLDEAAFPFLGRRPQAQFPSEIVVFFVGGATYEEAVHISSLNRNGASVLLGGTVVHNSRTFIEQVTSTKMEKRLALS